MFVCVGVANMVVAALVLLFLPDSVESSRLLTQAKKQALTLHLAIDQSGSGAKVFRASSLLELLLDAQVWLLLLLTILISEPSDVVTTFSSTVIENLGYTPKQSALLGMPSGLISITATLACTFAILRDLPRWLSVCVALVPAVLGAGLLSFSPKGNAGGLAEVYLVNATVAPLILIYNWVGGNVAGYTKKVSANALISIGFGVANIIGPQSFQARTAPDYLPAKIMILVVDSSAIVAVILLRLLYGHRNRKTAGFRKAQLDAVATGRVPDDELNLFEDLTNRKNKAFLYVY